MAAIDKAARLEAERQNAKEQSALEVQQLDPPFPFKVVKVDLKFFGFGAGYIVTKTGTPSLKTA
jgi:hypothetical protein